MIGGEGVRSISGCLALDPAIVGIGGDPFGSTVLLLLPAGFFGLVSEGITVLFLFLIGLSGDAWALLFTGGGELFGATDWNFASRISLIWGLTLAVQLYPC
jgi:hypothetical protein